MLAWVGNMGTHCSEGRVICHQGNWKQTGIEVIAPTSVYSTQIKAKKFKVQPRIKENTLMKATWNDTGMNLSFHWPLLLHIPFVQLSAFWRAFESLNSFPYLVLRSSIQGLAVPLILLKNFMILEVNAMILIKAFAKLNADNDFLTSWVTLNSTTRGQSDERTL